MVNSLSPFGLTVDSITDIITNLTTGMQGIYGSDINVDSNSPDGQLINLFAQTVADLNQLLVDVYNGFAVDSAYGSVLDQRVALNGIARKQGTFTTTPVTVTVNQALTLPGLDQTTTPAFVVADNAGNQYSLQISHVFGSAGSASLTFQAVAIGQVEVLANTITNIITAILGVTSVNNPSVSGTITGVNEETDAQLKVRHAQSFALASTGPADAISAALLAIADVTDAYVVENVTNGTVNTVPAHSIWCIVAGGTAAEIAQAIYAKKGIGCDMKGGQSYVIGRPNGTSFTAKWDTALTETLYIELTINGIVPGTSFDTSAIAIALAAALTYKLGQSPNIGEVVTAMQTIAPNGYCTALGVSTDNSNFFDVVSPSDAQHYFQVLAANITVNT
jgi:uncharacterized phage protein gp47/JayE